jgi:amino acid transporter
MAQERMAPRFLGKTNRRGVPVAAIIFTNLFGALSMMNISTGAGKAYSYIVNLSGVSTFLVWASISFTHIRFRQAWKIQGRSVQELPFRSWGYPYNAYFGVFSNIFLALVQGWTTLSPFDASLFVDAYILLPLFPIIYFTYKFFAKTSYWRLHEIDLDYGKRKDLDTREELLGEDGATHKRTLWQRLVRNF